MQHSQFKKVVFYGISQVIESGLGVMNIGLGELGTLKIGKSSLVDYVAYPNKEGRNLLYVKESNLLTTGTVDLKCESMVQDKRNIIIIDVQGYVE